MEMAALEPQESKITAGQMSEEEVNRIGSQKYGGCCYCCGKKGHMASQCCFHMYNCHKCGKVGHLLVVCPGDKSIHTAKKKPEKQQDNMNATNTRFIKNLKSE